MPIPEVRLTATADIQRVTAGEVVAITVEVFDEVSDQVMVGLEDATDVVATFIGKPDPEADDPCAPVAVQVTMGDGGGITLLEDGRLSVTLDADQTSALQPGSDMPWELKITLADDSVRIVRLDDQLDVLVPLF